MKKKTTSEYLKRFRKVLKSILNEGNTIQAINSWAVPVVRYSAEVVDWTHNELDERDRKTRKVMTANHALHSQSDVDRLNMLRKEGGRGLLQVKQTVEEEKRALGDYLLNSTEDALKQSPRKTYSKWRAPRQTTGKRNSIIAETDGRAKCFTVNTSKTSREKWTLRRLGAG